MPSLKLLIGCPYTPKLGVSGRLGPQPDTRILGLFAPDCARSKLPSFLDGLTFTFPKIFVGGAQDQTQEIVQNFYHHDDFIIGTRPIVQLFSKAAPMGLDVAEIKVRHDNGSVPNDPYYAIKVTQVVDCIDPDKSFVGDNKEKSFAHARVEYDLDTDSCWEFVNHGVAKYVSYPSLHNDVNSVHIIEDKLPRNASVVQPAFWPGHLFVSDEFAQELERICLGGTRGYYFWTLDLSAITRSRLDLLQALR